MKFEKEVKNTQMDIIKYNYVVEMNNRQEQ